MLNLRKIRGILYKKLRKKQYIKKEKKLLEKQKLEQRSRAGKMLQILKEDGGKRKIRKIKTNRLEKMMKKKRKKETLDSFKILPGLKVFNIAWEKNKPVTYSLIRPYAYASIRWEHETNSMTYNVLEPSLTQIQKNMLDKIKEGLMQTIDISLDKVKRKQALITFLETNVKNMINEYGFKVTKSDYNKMMYYVYRDFIGMNEIEPLLEDPFIEDISCDGTGTPLYVVHHKLGSLRTNIVFEKESKLKEFVIKLAERSDRYISYAEPLLDGSLPDGTRIQASLASDVTTKGPTFSIRKFPEKPMTPPDMITLGTASPELLAFMWFVMENGANILICGGTSTGKTSFLNAISLFINPESKIVSIEDTRELRLPHENWIPGVSRTGFTGTKVGEVSMFDLLRESFRQNPDYLIVGEVRGEEAAIMFQGMASGHISISTMHAGGVDDVIKRLTTRPINLVPSLVEILDLVVVMVHARERGKASRRVKEVVEILGLTKDNANTRNKFEWNAAEDSFVSSEKSKTLDKISAEKGIAMEKIQEELIDRERLLKWMTEKKINNWENVSKYIVMYYRNKEKTMNLIKGKKNAI